jgi:hypothetical protein
MLFAHHLEPQHVPVLLCLFAAGCYVGWHGLSRFLGRVPVAPADRADHDLRG